MQIKFNKHYLLFLTIFWCGITFANEDINTSMATGGDQIIISPMNTMLDVTDTVSVSVLILTEDGNPIEGRKVQIISQNRQILSTNISSSVSDESGYISFYILGKRQGDSTVTVTDGVASSQIDVAIRNLIHYILPYFSGEMQLSIINPTEDLNFVKIKFYENSERQLEPVFCKNGSKGDEDSPPFRRIGY